MSFQTFVTERLAAITATINAIATNAKKIDELPVQTNLNPASKIHVSRAGISESLEVQKIIDAVASGSYDQLLAIGEITLAGNVATIPANVQWKINEVYYGNIANIVRTIPYSATGLARKDILVANTLNDIVLVQGSETAGITIRPNIPINTVLVTEMDVTDASVGTPSPPTTGDTFVPKQESQDFNANYGATAVIEQINLIDVRSSISLFGSATDVKSVQVSGEFIRLGKPHFFKNRTGHDVKLWHMAGTGNIKYFFPNAQDFIVKPNEVIEFNTNANDSSANKFEFVGLLPLDISTKKNKVLAVTTEASIAKTLTATDECIVFTNANPVTFTLPTNASVPIPIGTTVQYTQQGDGVVTVGGAGITFVTNLDLAMVKGETRTLTKIGTDTWTVDGSKLPSNIYDFVYLDDTLGSDSTGELFNPNRPYKTMQAVINVLISHAPSNFGENIYIVTKGLGATYNVNQRNVINSFNLISNNNCVFNFNNGMDIKYSFILKVKGTVNFNWTPTTTYNNSAFMSFNMSEARMLEIDVHFLNFNNTTGSGFDRGWFRNWSATGVILPWKINKFRVDSGIGILGSNISVPLDFEINELELREVIASYKPGLFSQGSCRIFNVGKLTNNYLSGASFFGINKFTVFQITGVGLTIFGNTTYLTGESYSNLILCNIPGSYYSQIIGIGQKINISYTVTISQLVNLTVSSGRTSDTIEGVGCCKISNMSINIIDTGSFLTSARFCLLDVRDSAKTPQLILHDVSIIFPQNRPMVIWVNAPSDATGLIPRAVIFKGSCYIDNGTAPLITTDGSNPINIPSNFILKEGSIFHKSGVYKTVITNLPNILNNSTY